jgi:hypothetical protein
VHAVPPGATAAVADHVAGVLVILGLSTTARGVARVVIARALFVSRGVVPEHRSTARERVGYGAERFHFEVFEIEPELLHRASPGDGVGTSRICGRITFNAKDNLTQIDKQVLARRRRNAFRGYTKIVKRHFGDPAFARTPASPY